MKTNTLITQYFSAKNYLSENPQFIEPSIFCFSWFSILEIHALFWNGIDTCNMASEIIYHNIKENRYAILVNDLHVSKVATPITFKSNCTSY